jgi:hypothetical protein
MAPVLAPAAPATVPAALVAGLKAAGLPVDLNRAM